MKLMVSVMCILNVSSLSSLRVAQSCTSQASVLTTKLGVSRVGLEFAQGSTLYTYRLLTVYSLESRVVLNLARV